LSQALFGRVPFDVIRIRELIKAVADEVMLFAQIAHCKGLPQRRQSTAAQRLLLQRPFEECTGFVCIFVGDTQ
jgi:hypothetical protein